MKIFMRKVVDLRFNTGLTSCKSVLAILKKKGLYMNGIDGGVNPDCEAPKNGIGVIVKNKCGFNVTL